MKKRKGKDFCAYKLSGSPPPLPSVPVPRLLPNPVAKEHFHLTSHDYQSETREGSFDLKIFNMNVWGVKTAEQKRMAAIAKMLRKSNYDAVLVQEAWYNVDYHLLAKTFPYVTNYGTPG